MFSACNYKPSRLPYGTHSNAVQVLWNLYSAVKLHVKLRDGITCKWINDKAKIDYALNSACKQGLSDKLG